MSSSDQDRAWDAALSACRTLRAKSGTVEDMVLFLRRAGFWKIDTIKALRELEGMTLPEAKTAVHLSPAWSDRYEADEALHDQAEAALRMFSQPSTPGEKDAEE